MITTDEKCYSMNEENFFDEIEDLFFDLAELGSGIYEIYEGNKTKFQITDLIVPDSIIDYINRRGEDECGEFFESYIIDSDNEKINNSLLDHIEKWLKENNIFPECYIVKNIKKIKIKYDYENNDYELIKDEK